MRPLASAKFGDWPSSVESPCDDPTGASSPEGNGLETAAGRRLIGGQRGHVRSALAEAEAVSEGNLREIGDAEAAAQHSGGGELESRAETRLDIVPVGVECSARISADAGEADAAVDLVVGKGRLVDL